MLTLNIIRHAKTNQISASGRDFDRELLEKGIAQANVLGVYLRDNHIKLGKVCCSSAKRTHSTFEIIRKHTSLYEKFQMDEKLYLASQLLLFEYVAEQKDTTLTLIGHNEGISQLVSYFTEEECELRTAEYISLSFPFDEWDHISRGTAIIQMRYRPEVFLP